MLIAMMHGNGDHINGDHVMSGWMVLWGVLALALLVLAVVATIWLVKHLNGSSGSEHQRLLERRYAAGELDRKEFLQRRDDLARRR